IDRADPDAGSWTEDSDGLANQERAASGTTTCGRTRDRAPADCAAIEVVARIELEAGLGRRDIKCPAARRIHHPRRVARLIGRCPRAPSIQDEVVVVALSAANCSWSAPTGSGVLKSKGVPATGAISPVGSCVSSVGV